MGTPRQNTTGALLWLHGYGERASDVLADMRRRLPHVQHLFVPDIATPSGRVRYERGTGARVLSGVRLGAPVVVGGYSGGADEAVKAAHELREAGFSRLRVVLVDGPYGAWARVRLRELVDAGVPVAVVANPDNRGLAGLADELGDVLVRHPRRHHAAMAAVPSAMLDPGNARTGSRMGRNLLFGVVALGALGALYMGTR